MGKRAWIQVSLQLIFSNGRPPRGGFGGGGGGGRRGRGGLGFKGGDRRDRYDDRRRERNNYDRDRR